MKRKIIFIFVIILITAFFSCTDLGTPPELVLSFTLGAGSGPDVFGWYTINYTLTNDSGEDDLENCKIQVGLDTGDVGSGYNWSPWTPGVDLAVNESVTTSHDFFVGIGTVIDSETVLALGFDNPPDPSGSSSGSPSRTIIYYE